MRGARAAAAAAYLLSIIAGWIGFRLWGVVAAVVGVGLTYIGAEVVRLQQRTSGRLPTSPAPGDSVANNKSLPFGAQASAPRAPMPSVGAHRGVSGALPAPLASPPMPALNSTSTSGPPARRRSNAKTACILVVSVVLVPAAVLVALIFVIVILVQMGQDGQADPSRSVVVSATAGLSYSRGAFPTSCSACTGRNGIAVLPNITTTRDPTDGNYMAVTFDVGTGGIHTVEVWCLGDGSGTWTLSDSTGAGPSGTYTCQPSLDRPAATASLNIPQGPHLITIVGPRKSAGAGGVVDVQPIIVDKIVVKVPGP